MTVELRVLAQERKQSEMKTKLFIHIWVGILLLFIICSCAPSTRSARLYSEDGKISNVNFAYSSSGQGEVWGELADGEIFNGEYFTIMSQDFNSSYYNTPWGPIQGFTISDTGPKISVTTAIGNKGTQIRCLSFPRGPHGVGYCRDSKGRQYQLHY